MRLNPRTGLAPRVGECAGVVDSTVQWRVAPGERVGVDDAQCHRNGNTSESQRQSIAARGTTYS